MNDSISEPKRHTTRAPSHLSKEAKSWWRRYMAEYEIDDIEGLFLLQSALESLDAMRNAEKELKAAGELKLTDKYGVSKGHPASNVARDCRNAMHNAIARLKLDSEDGDARPKKKIGRPTEASRRNNARQRL